MASKVAIANKALRKLGARSMQAFEDNSEPARAVRDVFQDSVDEVLDAVPWNAAIARDKIAASADAPAWGFRYKYQLPVLPWCIRVVALDKDRHGKAPWKVVGRFLHTDEPGPLHIEFIARVEDTELLPPLLATAVSAQIAAAIAYRLTNSTTKEEQMEEWAERMLKRAARRDGLEGNEPDDELSDFEAARL